MRGALLAQARSLGLTRGPGILRRRRNDPDETPQAQRPRRNVLAGRVSRLRVDCSVQTIKKPTERSGKNISALP